MTLALEVILVIAALLGGSIASGVGAYLTYSFGQRAINAANAAQLATAKAQKDAALAQAAALEAAKQLVEVAKTTTPLLEEISKTGKATHQLVNNDRSIAITRIADLAEQIARLMPDDKAKQTEAFDARGEANRLPKPTEPG